MTDIDEEPMDQYNRFDLEEEIRKATDEYRAKLKLGPLHVPGSETPCPVCGAKHCTSDYCRNSQQRDYEDSSFGKRGTSWNR